MQWQNVLYFFLWAGAFFVMMRFGCGAHVMGHGHHHGSSGGPPEGGHPRPVQSVDPVCGMTVETKEAKTALYEGQAFYFCSAKCRDKFEAAPQTFVKGGDHAAAGMEHHHGNS
jgi:YHS domain-containing protein